jgi:hypothetical protein
LTDPIAIGVVEAVVVVVAVGAVSGGAGRRSSYCCGTNGCSAIRIIASAPSSPTIRGPTIGRATIRPATVAHATACNANGAATDTSRADPSAADPGAPAAVSERVVGNKGRAHEDGGRKTYESITQHGFLLS